MTPKRLQALAEVGYESVADLLRHYPRRHEDRRRFPEFPSSAPEGPVCLRGLVAETKTSYFGRRCIFTLTLSEPSTGASLKCRWFNLRYLSKILHAGQDLIIHGRAKPLKKGGFLFEHPDFEVLESDADDSELIHLGRIAPIYSSIGPWSPRQLRRLIFTTLAQLDGTPRPSIWPTDNQATDNSLADSLRALHFPRRWEELEPARRSLAREELFEMQTVLARQRNQRTANPSFLIKQDPQRMGDFISRLPFELTEAQKKVLQQIFEDLESGHPMNRLLHGDVGSGKTIVAALAIVAAVSAGHSAALMAPTQVLARQHYDSLAKLLSPLGITMVLRTGTHKEKAPSTGPRVVIGTHALLFADQLVGDPALVVIDEQHKFGVRQRAILSAREPHPHVLVMSATPIPRTLALTLYGDLELSVLDEMPPGRTPVRTLVRPHEKLEEATAFVRRQLEEGGQAFMVYPVIEEGSRTSLKAATAEFQRWSQELAPHGCSLLHGKLSAEEKNAVIGDFRCGRTRALVSTTVIEVGIDVPEATILLVENAERFGLAQLHQLRGRVGRGSRKSWCILLTGKDEDEKLGRLKILEEAADGFAIAEVDLEQRGPGDLLGTAQTGLPPIRLAKLPGDLPLLEEARAMAQKILAQDPELQKFTLLRERMKYWEDKLFAGVA
jgi:ATP-dependent DNA helicase RecG